MNQKEANAWAEYDFAAEWCAKRGIIGSYGDPLQAFKERVRDTAYGLAMSKHGIPEDPEDNTIT